MAMLAPIALQPLEPGQLGVMRVDAALKSIVAIAGAIGIEVALADRLPVSGLVAVPVLVLAIWSILFSTRRRWSRWGYAFTGGELHVASGWLFRSHTIVPVSRVQHIDVSQGPVERHYAVASLSLYTAGSESNVVHLPGIARDTADAIRDTIREAIAARG
ncbi:PH domain-containing protein [Sphingomonas sp. SFZ2018-12]|uniref:PH domain-containing protein n=1 Tax=Sphingomonas sp. SFZ2018-12 TaxID=2683197 RepID=UPI001F0E6EE2|nr:PH domain-containing protein [Sphingomonas sp. SFZ2018-12]MCH4892538.1 PH domain-containing protein [Sphingomonas sp. SFZ2018-12]